jgi:hypothetical protein
MDQGRVRNMAVPDFQKRMLPLLKLASQEFQLSDDDRAQQLRSGQTRLYNGR